MGWVCGAGHFIAVNLNLPLEKQTPGDPAPGYGAVCHCGQATFPMVVATREQFGEAYQKLKRGATW